MNIELTKQDIELLSKALESHEREPGTNGIMSEMMIAAFGGRDDKDTPFERERRVEESKKRMADTDREANSRKARCLMLRARFAECLSRESEFRSESTKTSAPV